MREVVFTDLDGTLLNHEDYRWQAARPALDRLDRLGIPLVLVSSKTVPEMLDLRAELNNSAPFVAENGCIVCVPETCFAGTLEGLVPEKVDTLFYYRPGPEREDIIDIVREAGAGFAFRMFSEMDVAEVVRRTGLDTASAGKALQRRASEPLAWEDTPARLERFKAALRARGLRALQGGRFVHVMGEAGKGQAIQTLLRAYERQSGGAVHSIALGDSPNDLDMLTVADTAVVMPRPDGSYLEIPGRDDAVRAARPGARGWGEVVNLLLDAMGGSG